MENTIFEDISELPIYKQIDYILKFNSSFKSMGFQRVNYDKEFNEATYYPQLTLMVKPLLAVADYGDSPIYPNALFFSNKIRYEHRDALANLFRTKKGYLNISMSGSLTQISEQYVQINFRIDGMTIPIGVYLKERNVVLLYVDIFRLNFVVLNDNEYVKEFLNMFQEQIKQISFEKADVTEKIRNGLVFNFKRQVENEIENTKNNIRQQENNLVSYERSLITEKQSYDASRSKMDGLMSFSGDITTRLKDELINIKKLKFVKRLGLTNSGIVFDIDKVYIDYKGKRYYMGDYRICVSPQMTRIECKNPIINNGEGELHHPHINGDFYCYGQNKDVIDECMSSFQLKRLALLIDIYLHSYNVHDRLNDIILWEGEPERKKKRFPVNKDIESYVDGIMNWKGDSIIVRNDDEDDENDENDENDDDGFRDGDNDRDDYYEGDER